MTFPLIHPEFSEPYLRAPVGNFLTAPAVPNSGALVLNELTTPGAIRELAWVKIHDEETGMAMIDKKFAHAVQEVMWLDIQDEPSATLLDYFRSDVDFSKSKELFMQMATCASAAETSGAYVSLSWSNDPLTHHRPSIQGEKRLHFHLTSRSDELDKLSDVVTTIGQLNFVDRRRLAEEFSYVSTAYLRDVLRSQPELGITTRDIHPSVLSIEIGDWDNLADGDTLEKLYLFLELADHQYGQIANLLGGEDEAGRVMTQENAMLRENLVLVSGAPEASVGVTLLSDYIKNMSTLDCINGATDTSGLADRVSKNVYTAITPSRGLSYAGNFSRYDGTLYFNFRPCKFSDLGGAGCAFLMGMPVRVKKGDTYMTNQELTARSGFVDQNVAIVNGLIRSR